jgi:hypothetical protein
MRRLFCVRWKSEDNEMMRYITVYALNNSDDALKAAQALASVKPLLPAGGVTMNVYAPGSVDEKEVQIPSWIFGELVMVLNFDDPGENVYAYEDFCKSEAWAELKRRTKGLFSNETLTQYYYEGTH